MRPDAAIPIARDVGKDVDPAVPPLNFTFSAEMAGGGHRSHLAARANERPSPNRRKKKSPFEAGGGWRKYFGITTRPGTNVEY
jgi:hypothetical protein